MKIINLKDYYPYYTQDMFIEVPTELATLYKAHFSLNHNDGIEYDRQ